MDYQERALRVHRLANTYTELVKQRLRLQEQVHRMKGCLDIGRQQQRVKILYMLDDVEESIAHTEELLKGLGVRMRFQYDKTPAGVHPDNPALKYGDSNIIPGRSSRKRNL